MPTMLPDVTLQNLERVLLVGVDLLLVGEEVEGLGPHGLEGQVSVGVAAQLGQEVVLLVEGRDHVVNVQPYSGRTIRSSWPTSNLGIWPNRWTLYLWDNAQY